MQRQEQQEASGKASKELTRRVDDMLNQETAAFFRKVAQYNSSKWSAVAKEVEKDVDRVVQDASSKCNVNTDAPRTSKRRTLTELDLDMEELRLEEYYNRHWLDIEGFHLQEAFRMQQLKVEKEWGAYTNRITDEITAKKKALLGDRYAEEEEREREQARRMQQQQLEVADLQFHHPEKQKSLIHTAPVLAPQLSTPLDAKSSRSGRTSGSSSALPRLTGTQSRPKANAGSSSRGTSKDDSRVQLEVYISR
jgi:membrane-associated HD superfamily phosphohydrolase